MAAPVMAARAPRMPKLTYRNQLSSDVSSPTSTDPVRSPSITDSLDIQPCTSISSTTTRDRPSSDARSTTSSASAPTSLASSNGSTGKSSKTPKKKKNGMLSFLTMKEPSQLALEQYADSQRKQTSAKGGPAPVGLQSISAQKLPTSVPKVNSKWDGIPDTLKSSKSSAMSSKRDSSSSHGSQPNHSYNYKLNASLFSVASDGSRGPPNSLASPMNSTIDFDRRRDSGPSESSETTPSSSLPASTQPQMTCFFPDSPNANGFLPETFAEHPWTPPPPPPDMITEAFPFPEEEPTQAEDSQVDAIFKRLKANGSGFLAGEAHEVKLGEDSDESDPVPESHEFLFDVQTLPSNVHTTAPAVQAPQAISPAYAPQAISPSYAPQATFPAHAPQATIPAHATQSPSPGPPVMDPPQKYKPPRAPSTNFSRPRPRPMHFGLPQKSGTSSLPTLYEVSIASTDTLASTDTITNLPGLTKKSSIDSDAASTPSSTPTSSDSPTLHPSRSHSSRDRLGLGGRIRKTEVLPWESQEQSAHASLNTLGGGGRSTSWDFVRD